MKRKTDEGMEYISKFPELKKWINECYCCHATGYNTKLPEEIYPNLSLASYYIKKYFKPLDLNEDGLCEVCSKIMKAKQESIKKDS